MNDSEIIVIDNIIDLDYQEQIKNILLGEINYKDYEFPWYYTKDVTKSDSIDSQKRPAFTHGYVKLSGIVISEFHDIFLNLIKACCHRLQITKVDVIQGRSFLQLPLITKKGKVDTPHIDTGERFYWQEGKVEIFNVEKLHQGKNDSDETMEFLYVDINAKTVVELSH